MVTLEPLSCIERFVRKGRSAVALRVQALDFALDSGCAPVGKLAVEFRMLRIQRPVLLEHRLASV